ncbi:MAG: hypothetical protein N3G20_10060, partial [Verrucomicrobiae bacterium]|nr:hypothetical protein [Verrucomicrobiae bacterium]
MCIRDRSGIVSSESENSGERTEKVELQNTTHPHMLIRQDVSETTSRRTAILFISEGTYPELKALAGRP